ncbi:MAG: VCBS repeat-containing protein [Thermoplasmatales archaeon]|nr:VCBS repeat-containing protein [Thermoplasmatales archaeon]
MNKKIVGIFVMTLLIVATVLPVAGTMNVNRITAEENLEYGYENVQNVNPIPGSRDGWALQWSQSYGGYGHSQHAQPVGDIDEDGVNEVIIGGYGSQGARILFYNADTETYEQEHFWNYPGGAYNGVPSGVCILDLDDDGDLEFVASFEYGGKNGILAYDWDGATLTELDYYTGTGYDFAFDVYACDYDDDGTVEVIIANAPEYGTGIYHVTALEWVDDGFEHSASWQCMDTGQECPMVWSGDPDNDGDTEIVAACSDSQAAYVLSYDGSDWVQEAKIPLGTSVYAIALGDLDGDGIDEIEIGGLDTDVYIYKYQDGDYVEVWSHDYTGEQGIIEAVAIGDADNDGINEFLVGTHIVHVLQWNETLGDYEEEATLIDSTGRLSGVIIGDCDSDGLNEVKATEIFDGGTGGEFIYKNYDSTPPVTAHAFDPATPDGENGWYISCVTVTLDTTDEHTRAAKTEYKLDGGIPVEHFGPWPFDFVECDCTHTLEYRSTDVAGNVEAWKGPFDLKIDTTLPTITLTKTTIIPWIKIKFTADVDDECSGINRVEWYVDNNPVETDNSPGPYEYTWTGTGSHTVTAVAYDNAGNSNTESMSTPHSRIQIRNQNSQPFLNRIFLNILERFPNLFPILRYIMGAYIERFKPEKPEMAPEPPKDEPKDEIPVPAPETPVEEPPKEDKPAEPKEQEKTEEPDDQEEPILVFDISVEEKFKLGEPIPVIATLTNNGKKSIRVSEMNFKTGTVDFFIRTPDGYTIHYIGPVNDSEMRLWRLMPEESQSIDMDIVKSGLFGIDPPSHTDLSYEFVEGEYAIRGHYKSYPVTPLTSLDFWEGELDSPTYEFTILG